MINVFVVYYVRKLHNAKSDITPHRYISTMVTGYFESGQFHCQIAGVLVLRHSDILAIGHFGTMSNQNKASLCYLYSISTYFEIKQLQN